ncbi:MAG: lipase, partial [Proteobacteria bacterium]|nr:lipase [Pseudomonadota bacterium]
NRVVGAPLSGTEPLITAMGLIQYSATAFEADGIDGVVKFTQAVHGSLLNPTVSVESTIEMQSQMAAFHATSGTTVVVTNADVVE